MHLFHNLTLANLPSQFLHRYQLILIGDRGTRVWTTCLVASDTYTCGVTASPLYHWWI